MSKRAEKAAWDWAVKNKLDLYSMGQAYGQGYEQAEKDILDRAIQWLTAHADDYIVDMEVSRYKPSNLHVGGMCWEHLRNYEKITCIIFIAHGHPRPCKREGPTKWEGSHAVRRQEK